MAAATPVRVGSIGAVVAELERCPDDLRRYLYLRELQRVNADLFNAVLLTHTRMVLPIVYTPTVGAACQQYFQLPIPSYGLFLTCNDGEQGMLAKLQAYPRQGIRIVIVTDGERILGLGDLGAGGMGICEGKGLLYSAAAGVLPDEILPVHLDVGTNNEALLGDPVYRGLRQRRLKGRQYMGVVDDLMRALKRWKQHLLVHFEDFANHTAFELLHTYRPRACCFNDDISGTACVALAGLLAALRAAGRPLPGSRILFMGAGEAGTGIGDLIAFALHKRHGMTLEEGRRHCIYLDSKGLVSAARQDLQPHKKPYAHPGLPACGPGLLAAVRAIKPHALVGVSTIAGAFTPEVLREMAAHNERPIIFPLSNPTSMSECTFEQAMDVTCNRVLFASGSPFPSLVRNGTTYVPCQANNAYVFPALGHAAVLTRASLLPDEVFLVIAEALAALSTPEDIARGSLFPSFDAIQPTSAKLMSAAALALEGMGLGTRPADFERVVAQAEAARAAMGAGGLPGEGARWEAYAAAKMYRAPVSRL